MTVAPDPANVPRDAAVEVAHDDVVEVRIVSQALQGCRAPSQPGCTVCCEPDPTKGDCIRRTAEGDHYDRVTILRRCPPTCLACASCSVVSELELRALGHHPECDCSKPTGNDPCMTVGNSCPCYCQRRNHLRQLCPPP